ncbi:hypothetical protein Dimus_036304 [Dionaea muscipula]
MADKFHLQQQRDQYGHIKLNQTHMQCQTMNQFSPIKQEKQKKRRTKESIEQARKFDPLLCITKDRIEQKFASRKHIYITAKMKTENISRKRNYPTIGENLGFSSRKRAESYQHSKNGVRCDCEWDGQLGTGQREGEK